jgi:chromosome partitioning protein
MAGHPPFELPTIDTWEVGHDNISRPPKGTTHVVLDTPAGLHGKMLERVLKLSTRVIVPVQPSLFDMLATRHFLSELLSEKPCARARPMSR